MPTTPQSQARRWLRTVAREGARYVSDLPIYDDEPYACMEAAACRRPSRPSSDGPPLPSGHGPEHRQPEARHAHHHMRGLLP